MTAETVDRTGMPDTVYVYHRLRNALELFGRPPAELDGEQRRRAGERALRSYRLETLVLSSDEARQVAVPVRRIDQAVAELAARYPGRDAFLADLADAGLDESTLREALYRELMFDAVMTRVGGCAASVSDAEVLDFHQRHPERFRVPERRTARHILITINADYPENLRAAAHARIGTIEQRLRRDPESFAQEASRHSECPTALQGGSLGEVPRGTLYPELESVLFELGEREISGVVETTLGLHLVRCEGIQPAHTIPLDQAAPRIRQRLQRQRQRSCQKRWIARLKNGE